MARRKQIPKTFCTTREATELLGVSLRTAPTRAERGWLKARKTGGGHRRITRQVIERLLANPAVRAVPAIQKQFADDLWPTAALAPFSFLVADEPVNQEVARRLKEATGLVIDTADDGEHANAPEEKAAYATILMDGLVATWSIGSLAGHRHTPIIAMTGNAFAKDKVRRLKTGMNDFMTKSFEPGTVIASCIGVEQ